MGDTTGTRVVVLGGSLGGLLAARVLSEAYAEVLLVERDKIVDTPGYRRGAPHGRHAHGLVARGQQIFEQQFPGLVEELTEAGVMPGDFNGDVHWIFNGQRMKPSHSGLVSMPSGRPTLEYHVRQRVAKIPNVRFLERHDIVGIVPNEDNSRIIGARVQRNDVPDAPVVTLTADLVVDTTGRGSRTPVWLEELGYERPAEDRVKIDLAYTTQHFRIEPDPLGPDQAIIPAATPANPRGGFFYRLPGPGNRFELSLTGLLGDHPPTDPEGFLAYVKSLPISSIYEAVKDAEPLDDPVMFRYPASVWRHYERLNRFPAGYLVMGDAVCSFNPIYAQGMTVASIESLVLRKHLALGPVPQPLAFFADIAKEIKAPWSLSAGADLGYAAVEGKRTPMVKMINAYVTKLQAVAVNDAKLANAFVRVAGLIDSPPTLLKPSNMLRVLRGSLRRSSDEPAAAPSQPESSSTEHSGPYSDRQAA